MSWLPVFAAYTMAPLLLLALSVMNQLRERRVFANVRSRRANITGDCRRGLEPVKPRGVMIDGSPERRHQ
jgi:hypothetical protein